MHSVLFDDWARDVNKKFQAKGRKVAFIIDTNPAHSIIENLSHVKLVFLPPNTTSVSQPMDQGVIIWGEWPSGLRRCSKNRKVPGSNPTRRSAGLRDPTSLQGSR